GLAEVPDAGLHRADVLARHRAADDPVDEADALAARQRRDLQHDIAILAVPAALLAMPPTCAGLATYGLAIADLRRLALDLHAIAARQSLQRDAQMHLTLSRQPHLGEIGQMPHRERRVLLDQSPERRIQAYVVLAVLHRDRQGM